RSSANARRLEALDDGEGESQRPAVLLGEDVSIDRRVANVVLLLAVLLGEVLEDVRERVEEVAAVVEVVDDLGGEAAHELELLRGEYGAEPPRLDGALIGGLRLPEARGDLDRGERAFEKPAVELGDLLVAHEAHLAFEVLLERFRPTFRVRQRFVLLVAVAVRGPGAPRARVLLLRVLLPALEAGVEGFVVAVALRGFVTPLALA